jgi:hypothetical protein
MYAVRTAFGGSSVVIAIASTTSASSAPWRSSPIRIAARKCCSSEVARANSAPSAAFFACDEPVPASPGSSANVRSTSVIVSDGEAAGVTVDRSSPTVA